MNKLGSERIASPSSPVVPKASATPSLERMLASGASVALWDINEERLSQARESLSALGRVVTEVVELTDEASVDGATNPR